jgi:hypothetical protein
MLGEQARRQLAKFQCLAPLQQSLMRETSTIGDSLCKVLVIPYICNTFARNFKQVFVTQSLIQSVFGGFQFATNNYSTFSGGCHD